MNSIMPPVAQRAIPSDAIGHEQAPHCALGVEQAVAAIVDSAPTTEPVARPYWQNAPCPTWCTETHTDNVMYDDRTHCATPALPMDLSLVDSPADDHALQPATMDVSVWQHYRAAEPTVTLTVPVYDRSKRVATGEQDVELTPAEVRDLRDRLSLILGLLVGERGPLDVELGEMVDGASRQSVQAVTWLGEPFWSDVTIISNLTQWTETGSREELEVSIDVADNPVGCTPGQARAVAQQLHAAAAHIERLAEYAETANARVGGAK